MDTFATELAELIQESLRSNNYEATRLTDESEDYSIKWILQDPDTGLHFTVEVAGL